MFVDTHCHLNLLAKNTFDTELSLQDCQSAHFFIDEAFSSQVNHILTVGTSLIESSNCILLAQKYPSVSAVIGIHPNDATDGWRSDITAFKQLLKEKEKNRIRGIGECGLDRHYPGYDIQRQRDVFKAQIELSLEHALPLVIHTRDASDEVLTMLDEYAHNGVRGVIHCFSEDAAFAQDALKLGFYIGIGGTVTYPKNTLLRDVVRQIPLETILLETDAPFLPPQPLRGKQNRPAYIAMIADFIAELRNESVELVGRVTTESAHKLFKLD